MVVILIRGWMNTSHTINSCRIQFPNVLCVMQNVRGALCVVRNKIVDPIKLKLKINL